MQYKANIDDVKELLRKLPSCLLGGHLYHQWLSIADITPHDAVPAIKRLYICNVIIQLF